MLINNPVITGSFLVNGVNVAGITGSSELSSSFLIVSASYATTSASFASASGSLSTRVTNLESTSSTVSSSFATTSGSISSRVNIIETSYATTGSNNFTAPQQISNTSNAISFTSTASLYTAGGLRVSRDSFVSGTAYFNNVVVYGTSSIQYITSSQVNIGTNIITVNTDTPAVRFGGLAVFDSGSTALTGSLLWDSQNNRWIYSNPSGSTYDGGMLISGPRNSTGLGNEVGTTACAVMIGQGGDHITSSGIFSYGNATCFYGNSTITSTGIGCFASTVCASNITTPGALCAVGTSCFGSDVFVYGDLRMQGIDSFIWSPSGCCTGYTGFYDAYNNQTSLMVCNSSGHLLLQPIRCNVGVGVANPGQKLEVAGVIHSFDRTNGAVDGAFFASKCGGNTSVIIRSCGITYFNGGNVGINTDTPITKLQICTTATTENVLTISNGTQQLQLGVNNGANGSYIFEKNKGFRIGTCDTERLLITDTGIAVFSCQVCANRFSTTGIGTFLSAVCTGYGITFCDIGDTRFLQSYAGTALTYNGASDNTVNKIVVGHSYNWYSECWMMGATRGSGADIASFVLGRNGATNLVIGAGGIACFSGVVCAPSGIRFASGGSTLSNYETGTWTPHVSRLTSVPTVSYSSREGSYTRIGNMVYVFWDINVSSLTGGSGVAVICNLPITISGGMAGYSVAQHRDASLIAASGGTALKGFAEKGNNYVYLQYDYIGACGFCTVPGSGGNAVFNSSGRITGYVIYQA